MEERRQDAKAMATKGEPGRMRGWEQYGSERVVEAGGRVVDCECDVGDLTR